MVKDCPEERRAVAAPVPSPPASVSDADPVVTAPPTEGSVRRARSPPPVPEPTPMEVDSPAQLAKA
eukprot:6195900-Prorocentrum_lima.AAC.1